MLERRNLCHSAALEVLFLMVSFFAEVEIFRFWPKTMDYTYSQAFLSISLRASNSSLEGAMKLKLASFCSS